MTFPHEAKMTDRRGIQETVDEITVETSPLRVSLEAGASHSGTVTGPPHRHPECESSRPDANMPGRMLEPGTPLPDFTAVDDRGRPVSSADWHGKWTVLWWYVKADTAG